MYEKKNQTESNVHLIVMVFITTTIGTFCGDYIKSQKID